MMDYLKAFRKTPDLSVFNENAFVESSWKSPSNIALVKYWGKKSRQLPANPSLSMTLDKAATYTTVRACLQVEGGRVSAVNDDSGHPFIQKLNKLLDILAPELPVIHELSFEVRTENSFPHSTGIASSASGISAFTLCVLEIITRLTKKTVEEEDFYRAASFASRLGSGSACRSLYGGFTIWGKSSYLKGTSDLEAVPFNEWVHPEFLDLQDTILVVSSEPKALSSSLGHSLMEHHPYASSRYRQAGENLEMLTKALITGDFELLAHISESEALSLHALMMTSKENGLLLKPATVELIHKIRKARKEGLPVFFTLDAGPNIHMLFVKSFSKKIEQFTRKELLMYCENEQVIFDHSGPGPVPIEISLF